MWTVESARLWRFLGRSRSFGGQLRPRASVVGRRAAALVRSATNHRGLTTRLGPYGVKVMLAAPLTVLCRLWATVAGGSPGRYAYGYETKVNAGGYVFRYASKLNRRWL